MTLRFSAAVAALACAAYTGAVDAATTPGKLIIYDGTRPADGDEDPTTQVALVEFDFGDPAFAAPVNVTAGAQATANPLAAVPATASGTASWFRIYDGDGNPLWDGTVTDTTGNGDLKVSSTTVVMGIEVSVVSLTFTQPKQ